MLFRRPLREVAAWPAWEVQVLQHYLAKQPAPEERLEVVLANLSAMFFNAHRGPGKQPLSADQFLFYRDPWPVYSDVDKQALAALDI